MAAKRKKNACVVCGKDPAEGWAWIGDDRYCHGDDDAEPTCYMGGQWRLVTDPKTKLGTEPEWKALLPW